jgi:glycosyltransferase involved in cell wall biosynthesis
MYVLDHLGIGGAQTHAVQVLRHLDRRRFSPMVCALKPRGDLRPTVEEMGVPVFDGGLDATLRGREGLRVLWRLARLLRRERVDIAHSYLFHPNVLAPVAGRLAGVRAVVASKRSLDRYPGLGPRLACRLGNALAHRVTVNAEAVGRFVAAEERLSPSRMVVIPNGVSEEALAPGIDRAAARRRLDLSPDGPVIGAVSRLAWKKGVSHLLDAVPSLLEAVPEVTVLLVGDGPLRGDLEAQAARLGVAGRVLFLGPRRDASTLLPAFDVLVLPSVVEGMSNTLLEAMAARLPVVATDVGGNPEVVVDGETGFLVPPGDPGRLAAATLKLLQAPEMARDMGAAGRRRVEAHYRADAMVRRIEGLYDGLLGRSAA